MVGIFDWITGAPGKEAAEKNRRLYSDNQAQGLGYLDTGMSNAVPALNNAIGAYGPLRALGAQFGRGTDLYQDSLGINGPEGNARATGAFQASPGYNWARDQALEATERVGAGRGMWNSGNTAIALQDRGSQLANQEYGGWQSRLGGFMQPQLSATAGAAAGQAAGYGAVAGLHNQDAYNRTNLGTMTTSGMANANQYEADAAMKSSGNLWGLGMNLATLGAKNLFPGMKV